MMHTKVSSKEFKVRLTGGDVFVRKIEHADSSGGLPVLVFLHEALGSVRMWRDFPVEAAVATGLDVLVYDRPGYGLSDPKGGWWDKGYLDREATVVLPKLLEELHVERYLLFGHSDGGTIALLNAAECPGGAMGVVAAAAHVYVDEVALAGVTATGEARLTSGIMEKLEKYHGDKTERVFCNWWKTWTAPWFRDWSMVHLLPKIKCPVLVIQGEEDEYTASDQIHIIRNGVGGHAEALVIPGCRHIPHYQAKEVVLDGMTRFIGQACLGGR